MQTKANTIAEFAIAMPSAIGALERFGIDYCCNGGMSIDEACRRAGITGDELLQLVEKAPPSSERSWQREPLSSLVDYIVDKHHRYTQEAISTLPALAFKVRDRHGSRHEELRQVERLVQQLARDLMPHMLKEEQVLFPYIMALEDAVSEGNEPPIPFFGTAKNPIRMMMAEHEAAGEILLELRTVTTNFMLPPEACVSFQALYAGLIELEGDLHRHIHLENNILFPRIVAIEEKDGKMPELAVGDRCCGNH